MASSSFSSCVSSHMFSCSMFCASDCLPKAQNISKLAGSLKHIYMVPQMCHVNEERRICAHSTLIEDHKVFENIMQKWKLIYKMLILNHER